LDDATKRGLTRAAVTASQIVDDAFANSAELVKGWRYFDRSRRTSH
jgi:hypothetical protein